MTNTTSAAALAALLAGALCASAVAAQDTNAATRSGENAVSDSALLAGVAQQIENDRALSRRRYLLDSLQSTPRPSKAAAPRATPRMTAAREGERATLQIAGLSADVSTTLSEPFLLDGRARVYLTLGTTEQPAAAAPAQLEKAGLLDVRTETVQNGVRVIVDAASIGGYGLEQHDDALVLWIEPAAAAAPGVTPGNVATPQPPEGEATPEPTPAATVHSGTAVAPVDQPRSALPDERTDARSGGRAILTRMQDAGQQLARVVRAVPTRQRQLVGLFASLLLLPLAAWTMFRLRAPRAARSAAAGAARAETPRTLQLRRGTSEPAGARLWAARTLAGQGLDPAEISERTGLCRDAVTLLVATRRSDKAAGSGRKFRAAASIASHTARR